jgi:hypothetical protein
VKALVELQDRTQAVPEDILLSALESHHIGDVERLLEGYGAHLRAHPKRAWDFIRAITPNATWKMPATSTRERLTKFHRHFSSLFRAPAREAPPPLEVELCPFRPAWDASPEFTIHEIVTVQGELTRWKSVGLDEVPNDALKCPQLAPVLLSLMNRMLRGEVVDEQKVSLIVPLPKKGDLSVPGNWRGISLMSHITKMFDKLLHHRVRDALDKHLHPAQNGFRDRRGCPAHIMALSMIRDITMVYRDYPVHMCFVDFSKAFDSVSWDAIDRELKYWRTPTLIRDAIFSIMRGHYVQVRCDNELSDPIAVETGVLQGDTLAPYLFVVVMDSLLRRLDPTLGIRLSKPAPRQTARLRVLHGDNRRHEKWLVALAYADDVLLFSHTERGLQELFTRFQVLGKELGLRVNHGKDKTERILLGGAPATSTLRALDGHAIPTVPNYKYLGTRVMSFEEDFRIRVGKAWALTNKFNAVWESAAAAKTKRQLFRALIEPVLLYGLCAWPMTVARAVQVDGVFGRMLRHAHGLPPAYKSHEYAHTEDIYGVEGEGPNRTQQVPFLSAMLRQHRARMVLKAVADSEAGERHQILVDVLRFSPAACNYVRRPYAPRITVQSALLEDLEVDEAEDLFGILSEPSAGFLQVESEIEALCDSVLERATDEVWQRVLVRRVNRARPPSAECGHHCADKTACKHRCCKRHLGAQHAPAPPPPRVVQRVAECKHRCADKAECGHACCKRHLVG